VKRFNDIVKDVGRKIFKGGGGNEKEDRKIAPLSLFHGGWGGGRVGNGKKTEK